MLQDLIQELISALCANQKTDIEKAYRNLNKVGVDNSTARYLAKELMYQRRKKDECDC